MRVIVIGAGILGACVAHRLTQAGAQVHVLEAHHPASGASGVTFAWVNACEKLHDRRAFDLNVAGIAAHERLVAEFDATWFPRPGFLQWEHADRELGGVDPTGLLDKLARLTDWGYPVELLDAAVVRELEPEVAHDAVGDGPVLRYPREGWIQAAPLIGTLLDRVRRSGGRIRIGARVVGLVTTGGRCTGVQLADGTRVHADLVVNCAGRGANEVTGDPDLAIPLAPTRGIAAYTPPVGLAIHHALRTPLVNIRPDGGGRLLLRCNPVDLEVGPDDTARVDHPLAERLLARARRVLPGLGDVRLDAVRIGIRPIPGDGHPALGALPGLEGYYLAVAHSGITLGALVGEIVADELTGGPRHPEVEAYRPARFTTDPAPRASSS